MHPAAYKIEADLSLTFLNEKPSTGGIPCHIAVSKSGKAVIVANYGDGNVTVISVAADGSLSGTPRNHSHQSYSSPGTQKAQTGPRAHNIKPSPDGRYVFVSDLGLDKIVIYKFGDQQEKITPSKPKYVSVPTNSGPRHFTFHPNNKWAYVINELNSTVSAFDYTGEGKLKIKQTLSTLPKAWNEYNNCADIHVHPNGRFLYGSNRGSNTIAMFEINQENGQLTFLGIESTRGNWPRNFTISPNGEHLLVAHQKSNDIFIFDINKETGKLTYANQKLELLSWFI